MSIQLKKVVRRYTPRKTMSHKTLDSVPPMRTTPIVVRPKAGKCSYRILTFSLSHFFLRKFEYRQLLKIPRSKKCYYEIKELLRALTSSMLLSLRYVFSWNLSIFFWGRIARYAQSKESRNLLRKIPQITCKAIFRSCLECFVLKKVDTKIKKKA